MPTEYDAVVVGSGPNGLAAAITLAREGWSVHVLEANATIGGATRSADLTLPGFVHDVGSAIHPLGAGSPFFNSLPLARFGLEWIQPEIALAHPLAGGRAASLYRNVDETAAELHDGGYRRLMRPLVCDWKNLADEVLQPLLHRPNHPFQLARFGAAALCPASLLAKLLLRREESRALFAGMAAHSFLPLEALGSASFGLVLGMAGHAVGWPLPRGGSQAIAEALAGYLRELGGTIELDRRITDLKQLPRARVVLLDVTAVAIRAHGGRTAALELPQPTRALPARARRFQNGLCALRSDSMDGRSMSSGWNRPCGWKFGRNRRRGTRSGARKTSRAPIRVGSTAKPLRSNARA